MIAVRAALITFGTVTLLTEAAVLLTASAEDHLRWQNLAGIGILALLALIAGCTLELAALIRRSDADG